MRRIVAALSVCFLLVFGLAGCEQEKTYQDGVYTAQFKDFDTYGYKDFIRVTVEGGTVVELVYDAVDADGNLKTDDADYQARMSLVGETWPRRYTGDLVNQFMQNGDIEQVTVVAGATWSSECFVALYEALEENIQNGDTTLLLVDNVLEKK